MAGSGGSVPGRTLIAGGRAVQVRRGLLAVGVAGLAGFAVAVGELSLSLKAERRALTAERDALARRTAELRAEITERERAQAAERFQAQLLAAVNEAVIATDTQGEILYFNAAAERLYGWVAEEVLGRPITEVTVPDLGHAQAVEIMDRLARGESWTGEFTTRRRDGSQLPVLVANAPVFDPDGGLVGIIGVSTDVSGFHDTIDDLSRDDELRLTFLRATSHELRSPLAAIVGFAETLRDHGDALAVAQRADLLDRLVAKARHLTELLGDLLDVDRLSSGAGLADRMPVRIDTLVQRVVTEIDTDGYDVALELEPVTAAVDGPKLERVVVNLLVNALRHTPVGSGIRVQVATDAAHVILTVLDRGPGVDTEYLERIFEPFVQGPDRSQHDGPGSGLGLALSRAIVELHEGTIHVTNHPDGGACFTVRLPLGAVRVPHSVAAETRVTTVGDG